MKNIRFVCAFLLASLFTVGTAAQDAQGFKVVVHPSNQVASLERSVVKKMFLKKESKWPNGSKVQPVDLKASSSVRKVFSKKAVGKSVRSIKSYWQQQIFSGRGVPPPEKSSNQSVLSYVSTHPGAIGYVSASTNTANVKVLQIN